MVGIGIIAILSIENARICDILGGKVVSKGGIPVKFCQEIT